MDTAVAPAPLARELRLWVAPIVRLGYVAKGIIYLLIGVAYAAWQIAEGLLDTRGKGCGARAWSDRALTIIKGTVYGAVGLEAIRMVLGMRGSSKDADDYARNVMQVRYGR